MRLLLSVVIALMLLAPINAEAQAIRRFPVTPVSPLLQPDRTVRQTSDPYPTYRREGGLVGALVLGLVSAYIAYKVCDGDGAGFEEDNCTGETVGVGMAGVAIGYILGSMIGGKIEKEPN